jgi:hypothetical protein
MAIPPSRPPADTECSADFVEAELETALAQMRAALAGRGIRAVSDVV